jgi:hypothetical protein
MSRCRHFFTGFFVVLACLFMLNPQPAMAEGQNGEGQGLNEPGDIFNAAQNFIDTATHYIIGRNVRVRDTAEVRDDNVSGEFQFGEPVQIVAEVGNFYQVKVISNEIIRELPRRFVHKDFVGSWEQVENRMKPTSSYMMELSRMADKISAISFNINPQGSTPVQKPKTKEEQIQEIRYFQNKIPGIRTYIAGSGMGKDTIDKMLEALKLEEDLLNIQRKRLDDPMQGEASAGVFEMLYRTLRILNAEYL